MRQRFIEPPGLRGSLGDALARFPSRQERCGPQKSSAGAEPEGGGPRPGQAVVAERAESVDQVLAAKGGDEVLVLPGGATGLFSLTGQLAGGGDGHGSASEDVLHPAGAGVDGALLRGGTPMGTFTYFRRCGSTGQR